LNKPKNPCFSSGPTAKFPGWSLRYLENALAGRSHRSIIAKEKLSCLINHTKQVLNLPNSYKVAIIPGSATGAIECALWSLLGPVGVDVWAFDVFGKLWVTDIIQELSLNDVHTTVIDDNHLPDVSTYDKDRDLVFTWNGSTSGVCFQNGDWIANDRTGLTLCDATSAAFCMPLPVEKLDVIAFSWQKGLGSEGAHGMLALSPKAFERLESYTPSWPIPRLFRLKKNGQVIDGVFRGETINTPSMICVEDCLQSLQWAEKLGGINALSKKCLDNFNALRTWVEKTPWIRFLGVNHSDMSPSTPCLTVTTWEHLEQEKQRELLRNMITLLREENVAYDIMNHAFAKPSLRIWCGPTVDQEDIACLLPWLEWAYNKVHVQ
jgi:phosphoserine aminotransferase